MVMKPDPWGEALDAVGSDGPARGLEPLLVVPTPTGSRFDQSAAAALAGEPWLVFAAARYEGIDQRVVDHYARRWRVLEVSIGDYVLAGGEAAVLVMVEALARLLPGVLGNEESHRDDSFATGPMQRLLEGPVYTKPPRWRDLEVPAVLLSGDHGAVERWRHEQAVERTRARRPDLVPPPDEG
jgi:tRNA (guanine37-N1)-methyltransferase